MNLPARNKKFSPKSATPNIAQNLLWMVWSGAVSIANSLLLWIFIARWREPEELGRFTIVMGLYALFYGVCSLGLMPFLVSEISRRRARRESENLSPKNNPTVNAFIGTASIFLLISGAICTILMSICGFLVSDSFSVRISTLILSLAMIPTVLICVAEAAAISFNRTRLIAVSTTLENVLRTIIPAGLIWFDYSIWTICLSFVAVRIAALTVYSLAARNRLSLFAFDKTDFAKLLKVAPTFAGTIVLASVNLQAAVILLARMSSEIESAKYGVASRFLIPVTILMASYGGVIQPIIAEYAQTSLTKAGAYLSRMASYPLILATLAAIASPFLSGYVLATFFGAVYGNAAPTLDLLALGVVPFCLVVVAARGLVATNSQHVDLLANALGVTVCFAAGAILIPQYGARGAALAQFIAFLLMAATEIVYLSKKIVNFKIWRTASVWSACLLLISAIIWKR